jgi:hypothetical protein
MSMCPKPDDRRRTLRRRFASPAGENCRELIRYPELSCFAPARVLLPLACSLPCCVSTASRRCGRGATAATFRHHRDGSVTIFPICESCARALAVLAEDVAAQRA